MSFLKHDLDYSSKYINIQLISSDFSVRIRHFVSIIVKKRFLRLLFMFHVVRLNNNEMTNLH